MAVTTEANKRQEESTPFDELMKHLADHFGPQLVAYTKSARCVIVKR